MMPWRCGGIGPAAVRRHHGGMPELPEVETARRGLLPHVAGRRVGHVRLRRPDLRWPIPREVDALLPGQRIDAIRRRAKYLLLDTAAGSALLHLGMSGSLRVLPEDTPVRAHDHVDIGLEGVDGAPDRVLRFNDPRRFGCLLWQPPGEVHPLLAGLGPEPLSDDFDGDYLFARSRGRAAPVKTFLMDQAVVVGVGNIYANEALFEAGIDPRLPAGKLSRPRCHKLATAIKQVLERAIVAGGSSIRDFFAVDGQPGYFQQSYTVYGRAGLACTVCGQAIRQLRQSGRSSYHCPHCQRR